jgi:ABC-2 type transport system permease protein
VPAAIVIALLGVVVGLAIGALASSIKVLAKRGDPVLTFYSIAALALSGVYFPIEQLPPYLRWLSYLFVHTYVVSGMRHALLPDTGGLSGPSYGISIAILAATAVFLTPISVWAFGRSMEFGRKMGLLAGY